MVFKTTAWATITRRSQSQCLFTTLHWRYRDRPVTNQFKIFRRVLRFEEHYPFYSSRLNFASTFTYDNMAPQSTTKELAMKLKKRWLALFQEPVQEQPNIEEPLPPDSVLDWWDYIETHYSESTRHYHTLQHLDSLLGLLDLHISELQSPQAVTLAVFFHDVIYDPKASDNEEKSAEAFKRFSEERLGPGDADLIRDVHDWILQTKGHLTPYHQDSFGTQDLHFFLDFDMQVLGWPEEEYFAYASQIRKEYIHYPESEYRSGRAQVLRTFLKRPRIYATELFHKQFELRARWNIEEEIKRLEAG